MSAQPIRVDFFTRIEGEAGLYARVEGREVREVRLNVFEPPRFFEGFLRGRHLQEVPDITARICGICPVAYQMSSVHALEAALGITPPAGIRALRRLMYCGEWIESHALHIYLLQAPDFLGFESGLSMASSFAAEVLRGLRLKKLGNQLLEVMGGRAIHPISVCAGGFYKVPRPSDLRALRDELKWGIDAALETVRWVATLPRPDFAPGYEFVSLSHPGEYPLNEGRIVSSSGVDIPVTEYEQEFLELHVEHSTALQSVRSRTNSSYLVGPLARLNLNLERLSPLARQAAHECGVSWPSQNPYTGIVARAIELVHACEEALAMIESYEQPAQSRVECPPRAGEGCAATEAPRGTLYHRYRVDERGIVQFARIVPPTAQNLRRMEDDLRLLIPCLLDRPDSEIARACEELVRCYDPCISCSTHFLKLRLDRA